MFDHTHIYSPMADASIVCTVMLHSDGKGDSNSSVILAFFPSKTV